MSIYEVGGETWLLPTWSFIDAEGHIWQVVAVAEPALQCHPRRARWWVAPECDHLTKRRRAGRAARARLAPW